MLNEFSRTRMLLGDVAMARLAAARVAVFGVGGVGGYVVEALARSGVGALELIDDDTVSLTNINRQIIALHSTVGMPKVDAARARVLDICPQTQVIAHRAFFTPETAAQFDFTQYSYVVDAIDTVSGNIELAVRGRADPQLHGRGQQARSDSVRGDRHQQNQRRSARARDAPGAAQARHRAPDGGLLEGARAHTPARPGRGG